MGASRPEATVIPEAVALAPDVAGLGSRMIAVLIDSAIQAATLIGSGIAFAAVGFEHTAVLIAYVVLAFLVTWAYFPLFEGLWNGRTPGKRTQLLRVVQADGQPLTVGPVLVRNLVRIVDFLPAYYAIGAITMILTRRSQRLGDLAAGTIVIRDRRPPVPATLSSGTGTPGGPSSASLDTAAVTDREYEVIRSFLLRRPSLTPEARADLARRLASALAPRVPGSDRASFDPEGFLEEVASSFHRRSRPGAPSPPRPDT